MKLTYNHTRRACYLGFITQAISVNFPPLLFVLFQSEFGLTYEQVGRLVLVNFGTQIFADVIATRYADRLGHRACVIFSFIMSFVGLLLLGILPGLMANTYLALILAVVVFSWGSGFIEVLISPIVESLPSDDKAGGMSLLHAVYCWGQMSVVIFTTLLLKVIGWRELAFLWAIIPLCSMFLFFKVPIVPPIPDHRKTPIRELLTNRIFLIGMLMMICVGSAELSMSQWSSLFAEKALGVSKVMGDLLGPCLFAFCMGISRTINGMWGEKIGHRRYLSFCAVLGVICYLVVVFVNQPIISLMGCALCGFGAGLLWPATLSDVAGRFPMGGTAMFGILAVCGDIGGSFGPWLTGVVSDAAQKSTALLDFGQRMGLTPDQLGLKCGLGVAAIFPICMLFFLLITRPRKNDAK